MNGAQVVGNEVEFRVWAPVAKQVALQLESGRWLPMQRDDTGTFILTASAHPGTRYFYRVDDQRPVPDPVSRFLPEGVHGPTEIVNPDLFRWTDQHWHGLDRNEYIIYELHVGTFTPQGTFEGVIERLDYLKGLGISVIEIMPVAAFPGTRNWGYDGVSPYAVQASYGGPEGFKRLVNAAHAAGLGVMLDVVYNHLGNEGNYLRMFGPYFTGRPHTPWGEAINFDGQGCEGVRRYFIENALYWIREYHVDGLRLDAIQTIHDDSPKQSEQGRHIVEEINDEVQQLAAELSRTVCVIAETDENDAHMVQAREHGGWGLCGVWSDDFHHAVHTVLTGEQEGYYQDFGKKAQIVRALNSGFVFQGEYFNFWKKERGTRPEDVPLPAHIICIQNHDQVGNRARGERLGHLAPRGAQRLAAALLLLAPHTPLLFMGEEFAETAPFQFFTDYGDPTLQKAVSEGRRNEFKDFIWGQIPDPQDPQSFERSKLHWPEYGARWSEGQRGMLDWYRELIQLRLRIVINGPRTCHSELRDGLLVMQVPAEQPKLMVVAEFPDSNRSVSRSSEWNLLMASEDRGYGVKVFEKG